MENKKMKNFLINGLILNITLMLMPAADIFFLIPSRIAAGGLYGLAVVLLHFLDINVSEGIVVAAIAFVLTTPLLIYSYFNFSKTYFRKTFYASFTLPLYMMLMDLIINSFHYQVFEINLMLSAFLGSLIQGVGIGIIMGIGGSTGGTDIIAKIVNRYFPKISIGTALSFANLVIVAISSLIFGIERGLASIIAILLTGWIIDLTLWILFNKKQKDV